MLKALAVKSFRTLSFRINTNKPTRSPPAAAALTLHSPIPLSAIQSQDLNNNCINEGEEEEEEEEEGGVGGRNGRDTSESIMNAERLVVGKKDPSIPCIMSEA